MGAGVRLRKKIFLGFVGVIAGWVGITAVIAVAAPLNDPELGEWKDIASKDDVDKIRKAIASKCGVNFANRCPDGQVCICAEGHSDSNPGVTPPIDHKGGASWEPIQ